MRTEQTDSPHDLLRTIRTVLFDFPEICVAYLFGSYSRDLALISPLSDVDIAILPMGAQAEERCGMLEDRLVTLLFPLRVDVINLHQAPWKLRYHIIHEGIEIVCCDERVRVDFETQAILHYLDMKPIFELAYASQHQAIQRGA